VLLEASRTKQGLLETHEIVMAVATVRNRLQKMFAGWI
jgi:hypothetical protein